MPATDSISINALKEQFTEVRRQSLSLVEPLQTEDFVVQPVVDVSPPKWHLGHTTWFFETMLLKVYYKNYKEFHPQYHYIFNSYYDSLGERTARPDRGFLSRPGVEEVFAYRRHVDGFMQQFLQNELEQLEETAQVEFLKRLEIGINH